MCCLQNVFNTDDDFDQFFNSDLLNFCKNHCSDCFDFNKIRDLIRDGKLKITEMNLKF